MLFNSHLFLLGFLPLVWGTFWILRGRPLAVEVFLLGASLVFYAWGEPWLTALIGGSIVVNYTVARTLASRVGPPRRLLLAAGIVFNLGLLAYFKYVNFFLENANTLLSTRFSAIDVALPLGISFFTFQQIGYLVDSARTASTEPSFHSYALFVVYFPQLVAGPIVHHRDFLPQVKARVYQRISKADIAVGLTLITIGLTKKVLFADTIAPVADAVFGISGGRITSGDAWMGTLAFSLQIYFDFSGYTDVAIGIGRLFGFRLPVNFRSPYQATSIIDFWRRWHITLSTFLRDYVYIPLGGNRLGAPRQMANVLVVMFAGGLWHGASWTFVAWGGLHGLFLVFNHVWRRVVPRAPIRFRSVGRASGRMATFLAVSALWVVFRAQTFAGAASIWQALADMPAAIVDLFVLGLARGAPMSEAALPAATTAPYLMLIIGALLALVWFAPNAIRIGEWLEAQLTAEGQSRIGVGAVAAVAGVVLALTVLNISAPREFVYFRF